MTITLRARKDRAKKIGVLPCRLLLSPLLLSLPLQRSKILLSRFRLLVLKVLNVLNTRQQRTLFLLRLLLRTSMRTSPSAQVDSIRRPTLKKRRSAKKKTT